MSEIIKVCKKHGELTLENVKQGIYKGKKYKKCRFCELDRSRKYYSTKYSDKKWVDDKHKKDNEYWKENKDKITERRQKEESKEKRREWYQENIERERERYRLMNINHRKKLSDNYVKKVIQNGDYNLKFDLIPNSLVELKRSIMLSRRVIKDIKCIERTKDDKKKKC